MKSHVAILAFPFASHPSVLLNLLQKLAPAASPADVTFSFFSTRVSNQKLFSGQKLLPGFDKVKSYDVDDGCAEGYVCGGNPLEPIDIFIRATPGNFKKRMAEAAEETGLKVSCLFVDAFLGFFSADLADEMGIPWLAFWTAGPRSLSAHIYTDEIIKALASAGGGQNHEDMTLAFLPGMAEIHVSDLPAELLTGNSDKSFPKMLYNMALAIPRAKAVLFNFFDGMDTIVANDLTSKLRKVLTVGPLVQPPSQQQSNDEFGCLSWLNSRDKASVAYISFGTILSPPPHELLALSEAIEEKKISYLWSFRGDLKKSSLDGFLERTKGIGKMVQWAPQIEVLAHPSIGVFVTHCGWSSLMESVACGVPMICRPFFGDQKLNRRVIEDVWQIGVGIEGGVFTKDGMIKALDLVFLRGNNENKMRAKINELKESALKAVAANGSSSENFKILLDMVNNRQV